MKIYKTLWLESEITCLCLLLLKSAAVNVASLLSYKTGKFSIHSVRFYQKLTGWIKKQMDTKDLILKGTFELFGSSLRKGNILSMHLYEDFCATYKLKGNMLSSLWKKKIFVHITQHQSLQYRLTAKPSGIQSTELSSVWHPGSSLLRMETQDPFNFTNIWFYVLLCPADTFLSFTLENPLISHGVDN